MSPQYPHRYPLNRRRFLAGAGASLLLPALSLLPRAAQGADYKAALVGVFLFGGNDGNNSISNPLGSSEYAALLRGPRRAGAAALRADLARRQLRRAPSAGGPGRDLERRRAGAGVQCRAVDPARDPGAVRSRVGAPAQQSVLARRPAVHLADRRPDRGAEHRLGRPGHRQHPVELRRHHSADDRYRQRRSFHLRRQQHAAGDPTIGQALRSRASAAAVPPRWPAASPGSARSTSAISRSMPPISIIQDRLPAPPPCSIR